MGDRRMCNLKTSQGSLYLYTHSGGYSLPDRAKEAILSASSRWGDESYCLRILVDQLAKSSRDSQYGCGLMLKPSCEDEYNDDNPSVEIDIVNQTLKVIGTGSCSLTFQEIAKNSRLGVDDGK